MVAPSASNCAGRASELPCVKPPVGLSERSCEAVIRNAGKSPAIAEGEFQPQIIPEHARRVEGFSEAIVSLYAKGSQPGGSARGWPGSTESTSPSYPRKSR